MKTALPVLFFAFVAGACAQTLAPELAPLAERYKADVAALEAQHAAAIAQPEKAYTAALGSAEKIAATAGNVAGAGAIAAERTALGNGLMAPDFPPGLPKELQLPRRTYLEAIARIRAAEVPRRQAIDAAYLRALTSLEARGAKNPELAKQVEAEKQNLLASAQASAAGRLNGKSAVVNGTFDLADADGHPKGWTVDEAFKIARDGANNVLRATSSVTDFKEISQEIPVPPKARSVTLSARVRGKWEASDTKQPIQGVRTSVQFVGADGQKMKVWIVLESGRDAAWKTLSKTDRIPEGSKSLILVCDLSWVSGKFDFDDVAVEFR
jgi:hypothetical protein